MDLPTALKAIETWPLEDQLELVQTVWDRIVVLGWRPHLREDEKTELDRRVAASEANPDDVVTWETIVAQVRRKR